jgi:hypothetical protein
LGRIVITNMTNFPYTRYFVSVILLNFKHVWMWKKQSECSL